jgi:hypothetical protein
MQWFLNMNQVQVLNMQTWWEGGGAVCVAATAGWPIVLDYQWLVTGLPLALRHTHGYTDLGIYNVPTLSEIFP